VAGSWIRFYNVELHNVYASKNIIRAKKSRRMRWAGHVTGMEEIRNAFKIWWNT
jgi:hypothetical protein